MIMAISNVPLEYDAFVHITVTLLKCTTRFEIMQNEIIERNYYIISKRVVTDHLPSCKMPIFGTPVLKS